LGFNVAFIQEQMKISLDEEDNQIILRDFVFSKGNAKLGDSLVNFIYSLAKSGVTESPTGTKVSDSILAKAYRISLWTKTNYLRLKGKKGQLADQVEALILFFWIQVERQAGHFDRPHPAHVARFEQDVEKFGIVGQMDHRVLILEHRTRIIDPVGWVAIDSDFACCPVAVDLLRLAAGEDGGD